MHRLHKLSTWEDKNFARFKSLYPRLWGCLNFETLHQSHEGWITLTAVLHFGVLRRIQTPHSLLNFILGFRSRQNHWNPLVRRCCRVQVWVQVRAPADQCRSSGNHSRRLFEKTIEGFDCNINGQALEAALRHSLGGSDGPAQTQGVS